MIYPKILLAAHNMRPKKKLGQNFLTEPTTAEMIVRRSEILPEDVVLEIGAGLGALTIPVARTVKKVYAVEKDRQILDILKTQLLVNNLSNVVLMGENILKIDIQALAENMRRKIVVMGNLPYNISSQVLVQLITSRSVVCRAVLMFQKELAQRITAYPGCKEYGRLTVMLRYCSDIKKLADVKAALFFPKPKVDSEVLEFIFKSSPEISAHDETVLFKVVKAGFGNRRKTLKNALAASQLDIDSKTAAQLLQLSDIDPDRRAETLDVAEFVTLNNTLIEAKLD